MKYCNKCGAELQDNAVVCTRCGCQVGDIVQKEPTSPSGLAVAALVFSILGGWIGLVLDIIGLCTLKSAVDKKYCKIGLIISIVILVIEIVVIVIAVTTMSSLIDSVMAMQL